MQRPISGCSRWRQTRGMIDGAASLGLPFSTGCSGAPASANSEPLRWGGALTIKPEGIPARIDGGVSPFCVLTSVLNRNIRYNRYLDNPAPPVGTGVASRCLS